MVPTKYFCSHLGSISLSTGKHFQADCAMRLETFLTLAVQEVITALKRSLQRLCFYRCVSVHGRGMHGRGMCGRAGMFGGCVVGVMHGGGHAWQGGMRGRWGACMPCMTPLRYYGYGLRSLSGRYACYWNTFWFLLSLLLNIVTGICLRSDVSIL